MYRHRGLRLIGILTLLLLLALTAFAPATTWGESTDQQTSTVNRSLDGSIVDGAYSKLVRTDSGLSMTLHTYELPPGHAFTIWWVIYNHPEQCTAGTNGARCGMADLYNPQVDGYVTRAAGNVIGANGVGNFGGHLAVGDTSERVYGSSLSNPRGAAVSLIVRDHGPADPAMVEEQIHTVDVCNPICSDSQYSYHER